MDGRIGRLATTWTGGRPARRNVASSLALALSLIALVIAMGGTGSAAGGSLARWHSLTPTSEWTYGGFGTYHIGYFKDATGLVHLRGSVKCASTCTDPSTVFTLPRADRPTKDVYIEIFGYLSCPGSLHVEANGTAELYDGNAGSCVQPFASLDNVSFPTN